MRVDDHPYSARVSMAATYDIVIVGAGLVGASLAVAIPPQYRVLVVDATPIEAADQPSFDARTVALTYAAKWIYQQFELWADIAAIPAQPIRTLHISKRGYFGQSHLSHTDVGTDALGFVVPTRALGQILWARLRAAANVTLRSPCRALDCHADTPHHRLTLDAAGVAMTVAARLVVIADGGRSPLADKIAPATTHPYPQSAILSLVGLDRPHAGRAYERFTAAGPLALLPYPPIAATGWPGAPVAHVATIWSSPTNEVAARMALPDAEFCRALQHTFGDRAGNFCAPTSRIVYPLRRVRRAPPRAARVIVIGNAAHTLHPVAGQGFNLGLSEVATLSALLHHHRELDAALVADFQQATATEAKRVDCFTHGLIRLFSDDAMPRAAALGLGALEYLPPVKRWLLERTMGLRRFHRIHSVSNIRQRPTTH